MPFQLTKPQTRSFPSRSVVTAADAQHAGAAIYSHLKALKKSTLCAVSEAQNLSMELRSLSERLHGLSDRMDEDRIQALLTDVECGVTSLAEDLARINSSEASFAVEEAKAVLAEVRASLRNWRSRYPDTSPIRIDNCE